MHPARQYPIHVMTSRHPGQLHNLGHLPGNAARFVCPTPSFLASLSLVPNSFSGTLHDARYAL